MITNVDAIRSLAPGSSYAIVDDEIIWNSPDITQPTQAEIDAEMLRLQAEYDATEYQRLRAPEYPPIGDQLDALLKHLNYRRTQGDELVQDLDDIISSWLSVKSRFPKND
jgi:hypothetical protein